MIKNMVNRGTFIVFEGCDRSGKTTQCNILNKYLLENNIQSELITFPNRTTPIGKMIDSYLKGNQNLDDHVIHLLFSANRWEMESNIKRKIMDGITIVCDRYSYSGVAFTAAKPGMEVNWCKSPEIGLPKPDAVLFLELSDQALATRPGFGKERYEKPEFQRAVKDLYSKLMDSSWITISADGSKEEVHEIIVKVVKEIIGKEKEQNLGILW